MIIQEDEYIKVGGVLLPGLFKSLEVSGAALVEEIEVEGKGKKPKQATGYEDAKINIELVLQDDGNKNRYDKLVIIQNLFKTPGQQKPKVYEIVSVHTYKRRINRIIFKELTSRENNKKDELVVSLVFWEYVDISITAGKKSKKVSTKKKTTTSPGSASVGQEYSNYLQNRGQAPKFADKTASTPAQDRRTTNQPR